MPRSRGEFTLLGGKTGDRIGGGFGNDIGNRPLGPGSGPAERGLSDPCGRRASRTSPKHSRFHRFREWPIVAATRAPEYPYQQVQRTRLSARGQTDCRLSAVSGLRSAEYYRHMRLQSWSSVLTRA